MPSNFKIALDKIAALREDISAQFPNDDELLADMLEGETDLHELVRWAYNKFEDAKADEAVLADQIKSRQSRKKSASSRQDAMRKVIMTLLDVAGQPNIKLPEVTASLRKTPPKLVILDESKLPDKYFITTRKVDMKAIKDADELPSGVQLDNGGVSLALRGS